MAALAHSDDGTLFVSNISRCGGDGTECGPAGEPGKHRPLRIPKPLKPTKFPVHLGPKNPPTTPPASICRCSYSHVYTKPRENEHRHLDAGGVCRWVYTNVQYSMFLNASLTGRGLGRSLLLGYHGPCVSSDYRCKDG